MKQANKKLSYNASVRWDYDLTTKIEKWFEHNPGWTVSRLINQSVRYFITIRYSTDPVCREKDITSSKNNL